MQRFGSGRRNFFRRLWCRIQRVDCSDLKDTAEVGALASKKRKNDTDDREGRPSKKIKAKKANRFEPLDRPKKSASRRSLDMDDPDTQNVYQLVDPGTPLVLDEDAAASTTFTLFSMKQVEACIKIDESPDDNKVIDIEQERVSGHLSMLLLCESHSYIDIGTAMQVLSKHTCKAVFLHFQ